MSTINTKTINRDGNTNVLDGYVQVWNSSTKAYEAKYPSTGITGDITVAVGSSIAAITSDSIINTDINSAAAIDFTKLALITTDSLLGRDTAGTGTLETITLGASLLMSGSQVLQRAALTGDVTASANSNATTVAAGVITLAKMANMTTDRLLGRDTASTGSPEELTVSGGLEFTGSTGIQRSAISGDITITAGSNTAAITSNVIVNGDVNSAAAIAYSKLSLGNSVTNSDIFTSAQIAYSKLALITTDSLLGRDSASTGALETITLGTSLSMNGSQVLQRAALTGDVTAAADSNSCTVTDLTITSEQQGSILYFNGTNWVQLAPSTDGYVLTTHSTSQNPTWTNVNTNILATTNTSTTAITFSTNKRYIWTGSGATSLTFSATGAVDGTSITIFFAANQISSLAVDTNLSPAANFAVSNFVATSAYILVMTYLASGPTVITYGYPTTDL